MMETAAVIDIPPWLTAWRPPSGWQAPQVRIYCFKFVSFFVLRHKTKTAIRNAASDGVRNEHSSLP
jgi:hypothetical protein